MQVMANYQVMLYYCEFDTYIHRTNILLHNVSIVITIFTTYRCMETRQDKQNCNTLYIIKEQ